MNEERIRELAKILDKIATKFPRALECLTDHEVNVVLGEIALAEDNPDSKNHR